MAAPATGEDLLELVRKSCLIEEKRLDSYLDQLHSGMGVPAKATEMAGLLVHDACLLTTFQAEQLLLGKWRRFYVGKYKVLERLGTGGMATVYLCEHPILRQRVALKVLPVAKASDPSWVARFYREARAGAALHHPNLVRTYDVDQDHDIHFFVMEYVDGPSLRDIVKITGRMAYPRAVHYIRRIAMALHYAHETMCLIHRDVEPGNILVDRFGSVKVFDFGLVRFSDDDAALPATNYNEYVLGKPDYISPEQAQNSHDVDIRADIYSLGATFYFCLTGRPPFSEGTVAQKLIWHQTRLPPPIGETRSDVPGPLVAVVEKMMAKNRRGRYQTLAEVAVALEPWDELPIPPPSLEEMPKVTPAARK